jgi:hypothetical protein
VQFTPTATGNDTLTCVAVKGNAIFSQPAVVSVTINPPSTAAGSFQAAGNLLTGRQGLAAALLSSGSVLVMGGSATVGGAALKSTELYNPALDASVAGPNLNAARAGHAVSQLSATQFLVTGGTGAANSASVPNSEIYDSTANLFSPSTVAMLTSRSGHTSTFIVSPPGVLIAGGVNGGVNVNTEELFNPATPAFTAAGTVALAPGSTATTLPNGNILLLSHLYNGSPWRPFATIYNPATGTFTPPANQPGFPREGHQAILLPSLSPPMVLILGGNGGNGPLASAEWFNTSTSTFSPVGAAMASPRAYFGAATLPSGQVLLLGGTADGSTATATAEVFDPAALTFTPTGALGTARIGPTAISLADGTILVLGGTNAAQGCVKAVETY